MPYTIDSPDLPAHVRAMPAAPRRRWVDVWNSAYARCQAERGADCEAAAFRLANGTVRAAEGDPDGADQPRPTRYFLARLRELLREKVAPEHFDECVRRARGHAGGMMRAETLRARQAADPVRFTSSIVALWPDPADAAALAVPGGERADDLHLTLVHLGDLTDEQAATARSVVGRLAAGQPPLTARVAGLGRFLPTADSDGLECLHALIDAPALGAFREALAEALAAAGLPVSQEHGFLPHITLAYLAPGAPAPDAPGAARPLAFDAVTVAVGHERSAFALLGLTDAEADEVQSYRELAELTTGGVRLFIEAAPAAFAEPPEWIPYLPKPGVYRHPRYGEIRISRARNENFVRQFQAGVYQRQLPLDAEHESKLSGAVGWITDMRVNPDGSADARVAWTDRGVALIEADRFKYVSPEFYDVWTDPATGQQHRDVAIGGAITTRPFFKEGALRPLIASERGLTDAAPEEVTRMGDTITLTEEQTRQFAELQAQLAEAKRLAEQADAERKALAERLARQEAEARARRFTDEIMGRADDSPHRWFGEPAQHLAMLERLTQAFGEESEAVQEYIRHNRAVAAAVQPLFREQGSGRREPAGTSPTDRLGALVAKAMTEGQLSYADALARVASEHPDLYEQHAITNTVRSRAGIG